MDVQACVIARSDHPKRWGKKKGDDKTEYATKYISLTSSRKLDLITYI